MNFLNQSDLNGKPLVKYIIIGLVVVNAFVLAFLLFGPRIGPSAKAPAPSSPDSTDAMTEERAGAFAEGPILKLKNTVISRRAARNPRNPMKKREYPKPVPFSNWSMTT